MPHGASPWPPDQLGLLQQRWLRTGFRARLVGSTDTNLGADGFGEMPDHTDLGSEPESRKTVIEEHDQVAGMVTG